MKATLPPWEKDTIQCGECGAPMVLRKGEYGKFLGCVAFPHCKGTHGVHQRSGKPLGIPADQATKEARIRAHEAFDRLWKRKRKKGKHGKGHKGKMDRRQAYAWMRRVMELSKEDAHIGKFTIEQCERLIELVGWYRRGQ